MSTKNSGSGSGSHGSGSSNGSGYTVTSSGTNSQDLITKQGNHYCSRDYGSSASNDNSYHYIRINPVERMERHRANFAGVDPNGSTYYNDGAGGSTYTPPGGKGK
ncbi:hypothetical protein CERZMDRAFT_84211 [Cercospora zeae-maydis SCOH1-5]|uniref:Uncharacterized protein n=1 Tax=Cercospora zeae-maydis SCOH1-5 TaxID=717836 RepID=A0A6A6FGH7_9PEZI|nr:hypothetical protein CERZMDRAFT_84211 [Cercospora zeae-maydis SCOH1-5]